MCRLPDSDHFPGIFHKLGEAFFGEGMVQQAQDGFERAGYHVGPGLHAVDDVPGVADGGGQHLRFVPVDLKNAHDLCHQRHPVFGNVVQPPDKGRDVPGPGFGCQHGLSRIEDQRAVGGNVFCREGLYGLDPFHRAGDLHHNILVDRGQLHCLGKHPVQVRGQHLGTHIAVHHFADLPVMRQDGGVPADVLPGHQGRIGGHPVQDPQVSRLPDLGEVCCVDEEFHEGSLMFKVLGQYVHDHLQDTAPFLILENTYKNIFVYIHNFTSRKQPFLHCLQNYHGCFTNYGCKCFNSLCRRLCR